MERFVLEPVSSLEKIFHSTDPDRLDVLEAIISRPFSGSVCTCTDGNFGFPAGDPFVVYSDSPVAVLVSDELNCIIITGYGISEFRTSSRIREI